jgi:hypothetical protein
MTELQSLLLGSLTRWLPRFVKKPPSFHVMSLKEIMTSLITSPIKIMIKQKHLKINLTIMSPLVDKLADRCLPTATTKVKSTTKATRRTNLTT